MSSQPVTWSLPEPFRALGALPVSILEDSGEIIASGVSGQEIAVPPGTYFLCVRLPSGSTVIGADPLVVGEGPPHVPSLARELGRHLDPSAFDPAPPESAGASLTATLLADDPEPRFGGTVYHMRGELVEALGQGRGIGRPLQWGLPRALSPGRHDLVRNSQLDQTLVFVTDEGARMVVLPFDQAIDDLPDPAESIVLEVQADPNRPRFFSAVSTATNAFIEYVDRGMFSESARLSAVHLEEAALSDTAATSLLGMIVGAYVLLRANDLAPLEQALDAIARHKDHAPDYWAILAEFHARRGDHDRAIDALAEATRMRCPWFRSGLGYQLQRLSLYLNADADQQRFSLSTATRRLFAQHRGALEAMAERLDPRELLTTFVLDADELAEITSARFASGMIEEVSINLDAFQSSDEKAWAEITEMCFA